MSSSAKWVPEDTPYVVIDSAKMERNILKMANLAKGSGVALRPHVKTHKVPAIARMQVGSGGRGDHGGEGL
jgi:D-serine deaminase-like pyridoxal phosphate-dependent protein